MRPLDEMRPEQGRGAASRFAGAVLAATVVAACAGENLFTGPGTGGGLTGPQVDITAPQPNITIAPGDSVEVTANVTAVGGVTEVSFTGTLLAGGSAPFAPVVVALSSVTDTTVSRYLKRSGATGGAAEIIVTAKDAAGDEGADTISVNLGS